jgi:hypothetical protein
LDWDDRIALARFASFFGTWSHGSLKYQRFAYGCDEGRFKRKAGETEKRDVMKDSSSMPEGTVETKNEATEAAF